MKTVASQKFVASQERKKISVLAKRLCRCRQKCTTLFSLQKDIENGNMSHGLTDMQYEKRQGITSTAFFSKSYFINYKFSEPNCILAIH